MAQSKLSSFAEACINIGIGAGVALVSQLILFPMYGIHIAFSTDIYLTLWFTVISLIRSYCIRRLMNRLDS